MQEMEEYFEGETMAEQGPCSLSQDKVDNKSARAIVSGFYSKIKRFTEEKMRLNDGQ